MQVEAEVPVTLTGTHSLSIVGFNDRTSRSCGRSIYTCKELHSNSRINQVDENYYYIVFSFCRDNTIKNILITFYSYCLVVYVVSVCARAMIMPSRSGIISRLLPFMCGAADRYFHCSLKPEEEYDQPHEETATTAYDARNGEAS